MSTHDDSAGQQQGNKQNSTNTLLFLGIVLIVALTVVIALLATIGNKYIDNLMNNNIQLTSKVEVIENEMTHKFQVLSAGITFDQKRKRLLLSIRDIIMENNPRLTPVRAYEIAEVNLEECERFQRVDPIMLTALQKVESAFNVNAVSNMGALGINQIWPSTGRLLCRAAGWEYDEKLLKDLKKSTYLACLLLDILHVEYEGKETMILADYNGGPRNARLYDMGSDNCSTETQMYVQNVLSYRDQFKERIEESI